MNVDNGNANATVEDGFDMKAEILKLKKQKNAVIMAHYYQRPEIQEIADYVGDSLALAQTAAKVDADIIVMCGVHFMGETAKILCPEKKIIVPDMNAGCSLADSCQVGEFSKFVKGHPGHTVISYVNTSAAVKAYTDIVVTSSNAKQIVDSLPADEKIIFGPDRNLGAYINRLTGRKMLLWDGCCHVHDRFSAEKTAELKKQNPGSQILVHPECKEALQLMADKVGSTQALLNHAISSDCDTFIVVTESGILHEMQKRCPGKKFIPAPADGVSGCNECADMKLITLEKLHNSIKNERPVVEVEEEIAKKAVQPIKRMLDISLSLGLIK